ncbi:MAG: U32 family peptidase [Candidatus Izemoplasmatales bacterium]|jgi:putative protease
MKPELLAPAGDLEKVRIACLYGADAVYIGGNTLSLRARSDVMEYAQIHEAVRIAHGYGKKLYLAVNIIMHEADLDGLDEQLVALAATGADAFICSDPYIIERALALTQTDIHLSTQMSVTNSIAVNEWQKRGVKRVVLARELTISEIKAIRQATTMELEVFIHGAMCSGYSGRCTLSNWMADRDANRGGCAHSCRWAYDLYQGQTKISDAFYLGATDLEASDYMDELDKIGVNSLKIEGRMKSVHYIASITSAYRQLLDDRDRVHLQPMAHQWLSRAKNRPTGVGFLGGRDHVEQIYAHTPLGKTAVFVGLVIDYDPLTRYALVEQRNHFRPGDVVEILSPKGIKGSIIIENIINSEGMPIDAARHPQETVSIPSDIVLEPYDMLRSVRDA